MDKNVLKIVCLAFLVLLLGIPSLAQNTKGDRPTPTPRDTRFKTPRKSPKKTSAPKRVRPQREKVGKRAGAPPARSRNRGEKAGKPIGNVFSKPNPDQRQKPWKGDIAGRRIRPRSSSARAHNVYPQPDNINYSSHQLKRRMRYNDNPNVKRVRRMQQDNDGKPRVGKPIRPTFHKSRPSERQRAWRGDITGRRIRTKRSENISRRSEASTAGMNAAGRKRKPGGGRIAPGHYSGKARNTFFGKSFYVNNQSRRHGPFRTGDNPSLSLNPNKRSAIRNGKIVPRSGSASFRRNRSLNTWAHFKKPRRPRLPFDRDLAGQKLRSKNYETQRPVLTNPTWGYQKRVAGGDRAYKGLVGGYASRTRTGRAWRGDVAHRAIRGGKPPHGREKAFLGFLRGGGFRSATGKMRGKPLPGRAPGIGAEGIGNFKGRIRTNEHRGFGDQGEAYTGNVRARHLLKGGGSISGRAWNNNGMPIQGRTQGARGVGYAGNIKARRKQEGGGSRSGHWNNNNMPVMVRTPKGEGARGVGYQGNIRAGSRGFNDQGEGYTGNIKARRKQEGGGSRSGHWNNNNMPVMVRTPKGEGARGVGYQGNIRAGSRGFNDQGEGYTGNIKAHRKQEGGGSRSGHWNNNNTPIMVRTPKGESARGVGYQGNIRVGERGFRDQGEEYTGNIKAHRKPEGGGSRSGHWNNNGMPIQGRTQGLGSQGVGYAGNIKAHRKPQGGGSRSGHWNNNNTPIMVRTPKGEAARIAGYQGNIRAGERGFRDQGEEYTGNIKARRPEKGGGSVSGEHWNNNETPLAGKDYSYARKQSRYTGHFKVTKPDKDGNGAFGFSGNAKFARNNYKHNPNSADEALRGRKASASAREAAIAARGTRRSWDYIRNPSSADEAQRTREPGRAFASLAGFQGHMKVKRFDIFGKRGLHPDAQFVKINKNNVAEEKDMLTNFKLWWARLFRSSETQPDHLKEKGGKPRYDKGEAGMWYE